MKQFWSLFKLKLFVLCAAADDMACTTISREAADCNLRDASLLFQNHRLRKAVDSVFLSPNIPWHTILL
jgi:hypothetical protein